VEGEIDLENQEVQELNARLVGGVPLGGAAHPEVLV